MTQEQIMHIGMTNSFNVITERNTVEEIVTSDMSLFAHMPDEELPIELLELMIEYFQSLEMFEHCSELSIYISLNYDDNGKRMVDGCECPQPVIKEYSKKMFCATCDKRLVR